MRNRYPFLTYAILMTSSLIAFAIHPHGATLVFVLVAGAICELVLIPAMDAVARSEGRHLRV